MNYRLKSAGGPNINQFAGGQMKSGVTLMSATSGKCNNDEVEKITSIAYTDNLIRITGVGYTYRDDTI